MEVSSYLDPYGRRRSKAFNSRHSSQAISFLMRSRATMSAFRRPSPSCVTAANETRTIPSSSVSSVKRSTWSGDSPNRSWMSWCRSRKRRHPVHMFRGFMSRSNKHMRSTAANRAPHALISSSHPMSLNTWARSARKGAPDEKHGREYA